MLLVALALAACAPDPTADAAAPATGLEEGQRAPELGGVLPSGQPFAWEGARGGSVLVFYRGGYCGLCRERLAALQAHLPQYRSLGVEVVAATPDPPARVAETVARLGLGFPVVSLDSAALRRWGASATDGAVPLPATFVLDRDGLIRYRHQGSSAADRVGDAALLAVLSQRNGR